MKIFRQFSILLFLFFLSRRAQTVHPVHFLNEKLTIRNPGREEREREKKRKMVIILKAQLWLVDKLVAILFPILRNVPSVSLLIYRSSFVPTREKANAKKIRRRKNFLVPVNINFPEGLVRKSRTREKINRQISRYCIF